MLQQSDKERIARATALRHAIETSPDNCDGDRIVAKAGVFFEFLMGRTGS